jgi:hypothetical protein
LNFLPGFAIFLKKEDMEDIKLTERKADFYQRATALRGIPLNSSIGEIERNIRKSLQGLPGNIGLQCTPECNG